MNSCADKALSILSVDGLTLTGDALVAVFSTAGYVIERTFDGEAAWAKLSTDLQRFDVIIVDHDTAGFSVMQLIGRLRDADFPGRIIVHARQLTAEDCALYRKMGVEALVTDDRDAARLLGIVKALHRQD